jgi:hypothetical protein
MARTKQTSRGGDAGTHAQAAIANTARQTRPAAEVPKKKKQDKKTDKPATAMDYFSQQMSPPPGKGGLTGDDDPIVDSDHESAEGQASKSCHSCVSLTLYQVSL